MLAHEFVARRTPLDGWEHGAPGAKARGAFDDLLESFVHPGLMHGFLYTLVAERERAVRAFGTSSEAWGYDLCAGLFDAGTDGFAYADPLTAQFDQCAHGVGHGLYLARRTCGEYGPSARAARAGGHVRERWRMEHVPGGPGGRRIQDACLTRPGGRRRRVGDPASTPPGLVRLPGARGPSC